jgi:hypothetical protein
MDNRDSDFILDLRFFNSLLGGTLGTSPLAAQTHS